MKYFHDMNINQNIKSGHSVVVDLLAYRAKGRGFKLRSHLCHFRDLVSPASNSFHDYNNVKAM